MPKTSPQEITQLLRAWSEGDRQALEQLTPLVKQTLRRIAHGHMRRESPGHVLQSSALMNEAYLRLLKSPPVEWQDRRHFFITMSGVMRHVLVDMVRVHRDRIRIKDRQRVPTEDAHTVHADSQPCLVAVDGALSAMEKHYPRQSLVIELAYYGGYTQIEIAEILNVHVDTVRRDQKFALAWLKSEMEGERNEATASKRPVAGTKRASL